MDLSANSNGAGGIGPPIYWRNDVHLRKWAMLTRHSEPIIFFPVRSAISIGAGCIGAPLVLAEYKEDDSVRCASPIFMPIAYKLGFTNRKWKYVKEKTTTTLKSKQTSIATVRYHLRTLASFPAHLIFHWSLPLKKAWPWVEMDTFHSDLFSVSFEFLHDNANLYVAGEEKTLT